MSFTKKLKQFVVFPEGPDSQGYGPGRMWTPVPLLERDWAYRSGLGWFGKNTMLLHKAMGSWFFLAEILVSLDLEGEGMPSDHCGSCTRCLDDCPTDALATGYVLKSPFVYFLFND